MAFRGSAGTWREFSPRRWAGRREREEDQERSEWAGPARPNRIRARGRRECTGESIFPFPFSRARGGACFFHPPLPPHVCLHSPQHRAVSEHSSPPPGRRAPAASKGSSFAAVVGVLAVLLSLLYWTGVDAEISSSLADHPIYPIKIPWISNGITC
ncbi:hypothetical protein EJB05_04878, partial [Eragrostis curvula]